MRPSSWFAALLAATVAIGGIREADACSFLAPQPLRLDPTQNNDVTPPTLEVADWRVNRNGIGLCESRGDGSCDGVGTIVIDVRTSDDGTPSTKMGFEVTVRAGALPWGLPAPGASTYYPAESVQFYFGDEGQDIDVELEIRAVDLNGNRSEPVVVHIVDRDGFGCSLGGMRSRHGGPVLIVLAAVVACRRRRHRV